MAITEEERPQGSMQNRPAHPEDGPCEAYSPVETEMLEKAAAGEWVVREDPDELADRKTWGPERTVCAALLRAVLVGKKNRVHAKGLRLRGVRIRGHLDLDSTALRCPLELEHCYLDANEAVCLDQATATSLVLKDCHLPGLSGEMLTVRELDLSDSILTGPLQLAGAEIRGQLVCTGTTLEGRDEHGRALFADKLRCRGGVFLDKGFTAKGTVRLPGAVIKGQLVCRRAMLEGHDGDRRALVASDLRTSGSVFLDEGFFSDGSVVLTGADVGGYVSCGGATLNGRQDGYALVAGELRTRGNLYLDTLVAHGSVVLTGADVGGYVSCRGARLKGPSGSAVLMGLRLKTGGDVYLDQGFTADGTVVLTGADIGGQLVCRGATLKGHGAGCALLADKLTVSGDVIVDENFSAWASLSFESARVTGSMTLKPSVLADRDALKAAGARIGGALRWAPDRPVFGYVDLRGAKVGQLEDDWTGKRGTCNGHWPINGKLQLDGFTYERFSGYRQATRRQRVDWIRSQYDKSATKEYLGFTTQPYYHLAAVYRQNGYKSQARKTAIAGRADIRKYGNLNLRTRFWNLLKDKTVKFGYQTWRPPALGLALLFIAAWTLAAIAAHHHGIIPVQSTTGLKPVPSATHCTDNYPCFYPAGYATDVVVPIINVHQAQYWGPDGHAQHWGTAWVTATWMATALGWVFATLLVAGLTGLTRRHD